MEISRPYQADERRRDVIPGLAGKGRIRRDPVEAAIPGIKLHNPVRRANLQFILRVGPVETFRKDLLVVDGDISGAYPAGYRQTACDIQGGRRALIDIIGAAVKASGGKLSQ